MQRDLTSTYLYHITDVENLAAIAAHGGLLSDCLLAAKGGPKVGIGYDHIKTRRMTQTRVACAGGRFVGEFVPFYFCPRSPMLFVVNKGRTNRPPGCQRTIVHLVTTVANAIATGDEWAYSDVNAGSTYPNFFDDIENLDSRVNWKAIEERANWSPVSSEKAAEFLVANTYPWTAIRAIGCIGNSTAAQVSHLLQDGGHNPTVLVRPGWYY